jgi:hypothetical protein
MNSVGKIVISTRDNSSSLLPRNTFYESKWKFFADYD